MLGRNPTGDARRGRLRATESLAGWVFADMLLVLFLVGIGTAIPHDPPPEPEPEPEPKTRIVSMKPDPVIIEVDLDSDALKAREPGAERAACRAFSEQVDRKLRPSDRAALVLVFSGGETATPAQATSAAAYRQLRCADPKIFRLDRRVDGKKVSGTVNRPFWDGTISSDSVRAEVYVYVTETDG